MWIQNSGYPYAKNFNDYTITIFSPSLTQYDPILAWLYLQIASFQIRSNLSTHS